MPTPFPARFRAAAEALAKGATLLTANQRLSRHLRGRFDAYQAERGLEVWPSGDILPLSTWLGRCWEEGLNTGAPTPAAPSGAPARLLSQSQALIVWEKAIASDMGARDLLQPAAAARLAAEARQMLKAWRLELPPCAPRGSTETAAFLRWRDAYEAACAKGGWVDAAQLPELVAGWLAAGELAAPAHLMLAGFDELTPLQNALLQTLAAAGTEITHLPMPDQPAPAVRVACRDVEEEIETAARWARRLLEDAPQHGAENGAENGAEGSIAIVAPELGRMRGRVLRIFSDVLAPAAVLPGARLAQPVNISQGRPLARHALVDSALFLLGLWREPLETERITHLLLSPYLAGAEQEAGARAMLDAHLRALGEPERPLSALIGQARAREFRGAPSPHYAPLLAACLSGFKETCDDLRGGRRPPSGWAQGFTRLLAALGWPDRLRLASEERQTWEKLMELFSTLAELDVVLPRISMGEAIARLSRLAADTQFQPESGPAQVQILGALEAGGLTFDHLWVLGLHDEAWPPPARPNPFLPSAWQREHDLPQSSAGREAEYARRVTARLLASAKQVVVSHPESDGQRALRPSRLISALPAVERGALALSAVPAYWSVIRAGAVLETVQDDAGPPLAAGHASGGTGLFKDQAACPFRAFANHRLHARPLETPAHGLDPAERGGIVHKVMERLWARLESSAMLNSLEPDALRARVAEAVEDALTEAARRFPATLRGVYRRLEHERLMRLVLDYLEHEKGRAPFTVQAREAPASLTIGGIEVNTRVDRIDRLDDDRHVVIDYKTGRSHWRDWFGPRPEEPQLPLYCASGDLDVAAVVFAQIRRGDSGFRGLQAEPGILPRVTGFEAVPASPGGEDPPTRATVLDGWKSALDALGDRFRQGAAAVDPRDGPATCKYCELTPLCRIHERARGGDLGTEAGDED